MYKHLLNKLYSIYKSEQKQNEKFSCQCFWQVGSKLGNFTFYNLVLLRKAAVPQRVDNRGSSS